MGEGSSRAGTAGALPNLIGIGAHQSGSSALHYYLDLHPEIQMSSPKELRFFVCDDDLEPGPYEDEFERQGGERVRSNSPRGTEWYASHFDSEAPVRGESTPIYSVPWYPGVAERIAAVIPHASLIFIMRNPLERAVSDWMRLRATRRESWTLEEALGTPMSLYVGRSRYWSRLRPFLEHFPQERIHLMKQEDLLRRRRRTMSEVFAFLGVDEGFWDPRMERLRNRTATKGTRFRFAQKLQTRRISAPLHRLGPEAKWWIERRLHADPSRAPERPRLSPELRARILDELEPETAAIEELTGWDLAEWRA